MEISSNDLKAKLLSEFESIRNNKFSGNSKSLENIRIEAINSFASKGFPTPKTEEWKYSNINFINKNSFKLQTEKPTFDLVPGDIDKFAFNGLFENLLVFVNGFFAPELSKIISAKKITIKSLSDGIDDNYELTEHYLGNNSNLSDDAFTSLNTAFFNDGAYIIVPDDILDIEPIHLLYINDVRNSSVWSNPRNLILVGKNSSVRIIETCQTIGNNAGFTNSFTEIVQRPFSNIDYYKVQNDLGNLFYIGTTQVHQESDSVFNSSTISLNGSFTRNNLNTNFKGEHSEAHFNGFYFLDKNNFVDNHTLADHSFPNCNSNELYKGILDDTSHAVFNGKIIVRKDAQKTNAYQSNKNILLSNDATINTKPQLEIFADDVKCSHGATTGYLDKEALFYLRARGISEDNARALMLNAFAADVISKINIPELRDNIKKQVAERLKVEDDIYFCSFLTD